MRGNDDVTTVVVHRGVLVRGPAMAEYYTSQPAPTQWLAVGLVSTHPVARTCPQLQQLLVGTGRTEDAAVNALWERSAVPEPGSQPRAQPEPVLTAADLLERVEMIVGDLTADRLHPVEPVSSRGTIQ